MPTIRHYNYITCDSCDTMIEVGQDAYEINGRFLCETCFDEAQEEVKKEARREVNDDNFDLEEELPPLGY